MIMTKSPALVVQSFFLPGGGIEQTSADTASQNRNPEQHAEQRHGQGTKNQPGQERCNTPVNEFSGKAFVNKGFLQPLVNVVRRTHYNPKKALMISADKTKKRQEPPQPMSSLLMS